MAFDLKNGTALSSPGDNSVVTGATAANAGSPGLWKFSDIAAYIKSKFTLQKGPTKTIFTSSGTWSRPAGCVKIKVTGLGGGGGGGGCTATGTGQSSCGHPGSAGGWFQTWVDVTAIASIPVTIGAKGSGGAAGNNAGAAGGTTQFGTSGAYGQATGGYGGTGNGAQSTNTAISPFGTLGQGSNGDLNGSGSPGGMSVIFIGGRSTAGNGGPGAFGIGTGGNGGTSNGGTVSNGSNALGFGAGGGGGAVSNGAGTGNPAGGDGAPGVIIVEEFYA